jgi:hypothetical protein
MKRDFSNVPGQEGTLEQRLWRMAFETLMPQEEVDPETASRLERGRSSLEEFTSFTMPEFQINWHHHVLFEHLEALVRGDILRLMVFMPPQHGKSESVSRRLPAYTLGRYPDEKIIACSYNDHFAGLMNRDVQRIIDSDLYKQLFPGTELFSKNIRTQARGTYLRNSDIFEVVGRKGSYRSAGIGGGIGGMPFTLGIIDDPIKDDKEANSPTIREAIWNWYTTVFSARKAKARARILITLTRWHQDDLAGRLLNLAGSNSGADQWVVVEFPAILEDETQRRQTRFGADPRQVGEALWEDRHPLKELQVERIQAGAVKWSAVFQQNPTPAKGVVFTRTTFRYFSVQRDDAGVLWVTLPPRAGAPPEEGPRRLPLP